MKPCKYRLVTEHTNVIVCMLGGYPASCPEEECKAPKIHEQLKKKCL